MDSEVYSTSLYTLLSLGLIGGQISRVQKVPYKNQNWLSSGEECLLYFPENLALLNNAQNKTFI